MLLLVQLDVVYDRTWHGSRSFAHADVTITTHSQQQRYEQTSDSEPF